MFCLKSFFPIRFAVMILHIVGDIIAFKDLLFMFPAVNVLFILRTGPILIEPDIFRLRFSFSCFHKRYLYWDGKKLCHECILDLKPIKLKMQMLHFLYWNIPSGISIAKFLIFRQHWKNQFRVIKKERVIWNPFFTISVEKFLLTNSSRNYSMPVNSVPL